MPPVESPFLGLASTGAICVVIDFVTDGTAVRDILAHLGESTAPTRGAPPWARFPGASALAGARLSWMTASLSPCWQADPG
jgi:hypothetical protein